MDALKFLVRKLILKFLSGSCSDPHTEIVGYSLSPLPLDLVPFAYNLSICIVYPSYMSA